MTHRIWSVLVKDISQGGWWRFGPKPLERWNWHQSRCRRHGSSMFGEIAGVVFWTYWVWAAYIIKVEVSSRQLDMDITCSQKSCGLEKSMWKVLTAMKKPLQLWPWCITLQSEAQRTIHSFLNYVQMFLSVSKNPWSQRVSFLPF